MDSQDYSSLSSDASEYDSDTDARSSSQSQVKWTADKLPMPQRITTGRPVQAGDDEVRARLRDRVMPLMRKIAALGDDTGNAAAGERSNAQRALRKLLMKHGLQEVVESCLHDSRRSS